MSPTYEPNEEPYNETSPRWTSFAPESEGWYWVRNITAGTGPDDYEPIFFDADPVSPGFDMRRARYSTGDIFESPDNMRKMAFEWWSERIKEPR